MQIIQTIADLRQQTKTWRAAGKRIALVPTMGNLHEGHLQLVRTAQQQADCVITSIFVNPTQFGVGEDFAAYPRTELQDQAKLAIIRNDCLFMPSVEDMYGTNAHTQISVSHLASLHCGQFRPGHFDGVATVVCKLFNITQADCAVFGLKDFQQFAVIKAMVDDLNMPIDLIGVDTVREDNGLALSSRNSYLRDTEKQTAALLYQTLCQTRDAIIAGNRDYAALEKQAVANLSQAGFQSDYFHICNSHNLQAAKPEDTALVILVAARLGRARLIDNVYFSL
ncbi:pantoate--beta-alanine ligase [Methylosoma difficile]